MQLIAVVIGVLVILYLAKLKLSKGEIYTKFGLKMRHHRLISTDLGKSQKKMKLSRAGINGIPDAIFEAVGRRELVVGEFKSRKYRDFVRLSEFYQITLYMGHLKDQYPNYKIKGCIAYADARIEVNYDHQTYQGLIELREEYWESIQAKRPVNCTPLHQRMSVTGANRKVKFSASI